MRRRTKRQRRGRGRAGACDSIIRRSGHAARSAMCRSATPRAQNRSPDSRRTDFHYAAGQAVTVWRRRSPNKRRAIRSRRHPKRRSSHGYLELLVGVDAEGWRRRHLPLEPRHADRRRRAAPGPFTFPPIRQERRFVFVAGGTGIAPLRGDDASRAGGARRRRRSAFSTARGGRTNSPTDDELRALAARRRDRASLRR